MSKTNNRNIFLFASFIANTIFWGLLIGIGFGLLGSFIYLIILFPLMMGYAGSSVITRNITRTKIRSKKFILLNTIVFVVIEYFAYHYTGYMILTAQVALQEFSGLSLELFRAGKLLVDLATVAETGHSGFIGYLFFKAQLGVSIGKFYSTNRLHLGPALTWIYWFVELAAVGYITRNFGSQILDKPFCNNCNTWYGDKIHIGGIPSKKEKDLMGLLREKEFVSLGAMLEEDAEVPSNELYLQSCDTCDTQNAFLNITSVLFHNGKIATVDHWKSTLKPDEKKRLVSKIKYL